MPVHIRKPVALPPQLGRRLASVRLRRPTPLPTVVPTTMMGRYLLRLLRRFGGLRR